MSDPNENQSKTWLGTPISEMYNGRGLWSFSVPPMTPSKYHHILFELPVSLKEPPQPHYNSQPKHWDEDFVRMPYSSNSLFLVKKDNEEVIKPRWELIGDSLSKPIHSVEDLEKAIATYNNKLPRFSALNHFFNDVLGEEENEYFFRNLLPKIIQLALRLPEFIPGSIPLLKKHHSKSLSLSQLQIASLLANAFLCTLIWRKESSGSYPGINFIKLFCANDREKRRSCVSEKFKCILCYFRSVTTEDPVGVLTFERKFVPRGSMPRWDNLENNLGNTKVHIDSSGTIEEGSGLLQVDFANKFVGGGVLGYGCVQEEIRFVICPELIVSRLFTEELGDSEALVITGAERYSSYAGYADSFQWSGSYKDETPFDEYGRRKTTVTVIDATRFTKTKDQFHCSSILRELNKAYVGFSAREKDSLAPVATGNWGCGAFKGDPHLKSLIQLMACSATNRNLVYYSFGNTDLRDEFYSMHCFLAGNKVTICQLWRYLCRFCASQLAPDKLYSFIHQAHFDLKTQPTLKQFLCFNTQKRKTENSTPSTSTEESKSKRVSPNAEPERKDEEEVKKPTGPKKFPVLPVKQQKPPNSDEIIQIINMIDGNCSKHQDADLNVTLLSEIDKMKQEVPEAQMEATVKNCDSTEIAMEVDEVDENPKPLSFIEDKKKKITDYFSKMTNHVNSYL